MYRYKHVVRYCLGLVAALCTSNYVLPQEITVHFGGGLGSQDGALVKEVKFGAGLKYLENIYTNIGVKYHSYEMHKYDINSFILYSGFRYTLPLYYSEEKSADFGIFPEVKGYFNPWVTRTYEYEHENKSKSGSYTVHFSHGIGGGIFYGKYNFYIALSFKVCTNDAFKVLRSLDVPREFPNGKLYMLSLSIEGFGD